MTQKKRGNSSLQLGRDLRPPIEACEEIRDPIGIRLANVFQSSAQTKIMVSSGGTRGSLNNKKQVMNELRQGKPFLLPELMIRQQQQQQQQHQNHERRSPVMETKEATHLPPSLPSTSKKTKPPTVNTVKTKAKSKSKEKEKEREKGTPSSKPTAKVLSNLSIATKDRIVIEPFSSFQHGPVEAKLGLRSMRILHKFISNSSKIDLEIQQDHPICMKIFQGYGDQEQQIAMLVSF